MRKILAANRGEIAIRIFRACTELGIRTVAIYSHEDELSIHRYKADEAYLVGEPGDPVGSYLDQEAIIELALRREVDAIHPGYGFLSENAEFARRCAEAGITFIGPKPEVLEMLGDKVSARKLAQKANVPVVPGTEEPVSSAQAVKDFADAYGYPLMLKAAFGGGGRGMRILRGPEDVEESFERAFSEARAAFGRGDLFVEKLVEHPRHIEIQLLGDQHGNCVHLFERDCSIQRRHQKVIEVAPAVDLGAALRQNLFDAALRIAQASGYTNAGTVEFLVDPEGNYYFIEVNPRLQVEHTITECITGRDLVQAQIRVAEGKRLSDPEINIPNQAAISARGYAIQCRITTEDPENNFAPSTGKIRAYRSAAGFGIRLDAGIGGAGTLIRADYDPLLVKQIAWGLTFREAAAKSRRALSEFRVRGVKTNIPFLEKAVQHDEFLTGKADTGFIGRHPELLQIPRRKDRGTKTLKALANVIVNGPPGADEKFTRPQDLFPAKVPALPEGLGHWAPEDGGAMAVFREHGADGLSKWMLEQKQVLVTDTTFRDAHQSLLATRVRTVDMQAVARPTAALLPDLFSVEMWGGATYDVSYRFLREDPWERLAKLRVEMPNVLLQMLLRGANAVGYTNYPDNVVRRFIREAARQGIDLFRIFDALNWVPNMELAMEEVAAAGKIVEACLCYTGDISDPNRSKYTLDYYVKLGQRLAERGAHILAIKDMAGLLKPAAARMLIKALKEEIGLPVHLHTHDTSGNGIAMYLAAVEAGVDAVDLAISSVSGLTSQPSMNAFCEALTGHERNPELDLPTLQKFADYWEAVRVAYGPFESGLKASTSEVYWHEIPGGQYSNLRPRAIKLGLGERWGEIKARYREVNLALGDLVKVTPSSKVVADFAMFLVQNDLTVEQAIEQAERLDFPQSVIDFLSGRMGQPHGGFPERLQKAVLKGQPVLTTRPGESLPDHDFDAASARLSERLERPAREHELVTDALYPKVYADYLDFEDTFGDVSTMPTSVYLYGLDLGEATRVEIEQGKTLMVKLMAVGGLTDDGQRMVYFELNGQPREVAIRDLGAEVDASVRPVADPRDPHQVAASMPGKVVRVDCAVGDVVEAGQTLVVAEAMKMETAISATVAGVVDEVLVRVGDALGAGELVVRTRPVE
ncbi:MAG: pyruvate carboxylase [Bradymonadia bacterium]